MPGSFGCDDNQRLGAGVNAVDVTILVMCLKCLKMQCLIKVYVMGDVWVGWEGMCVSVCVCVFSLAGGKGVPKKTTWSLRISECI